MKTGDAKLKGLRFLKHDSQLQQKNIFQKWDVFFGMPGSLQSLCQQAFHFIRWPKYKRKWRIWCYQLCTSTHFIKEHVYTSYGIHHDSTRIKNISLSKNSVEALMVLCNQGKLDSLHPENGIKDFLAVNFSWQKLFLLAILSLATESS